jgi:hypothetical protein
MEPRLVFQFLEDLDARRKLVREEGKCVNSFGRTAPICKGNTAAPKCFSQSKLDACNWRSKLSLLAVEGGTQKTEKPRNLIPLSISE